MKLTWVHYLQESYEVTWPKWEGGGEGKREKGKREGEKEGKERSGEGRERERI